MPRPSIPTCAPPITRHSMKRTRCCYAAHRKVTTWHHKAPKSPLHTPVANRRRVGDKLQHAKELPHHSVVEACKEKTSLDISACSHPSNANLVCQDTSVNKRGIWYRTLAAPSTAAQAITALYPLPGVAGPTHHVGCKLHVLLDSGLALHLNSKTCHRGSTASQYHYYSCPLRI
jgi:hypothetical protein